MKKILLAVLVLCIPYFSVSAIDYAEDQIETNEELEEVVKLIEKERNEEANKNPNTRSFFQKTITQQEVSKSFEASAIKFAFSSKTMLDLKIRSRIINSIAIPTLSFNNHYRFEKKISYDKNGALVYEYTPYRNQDTTNVLLYAHGGGFSLELVSNQINAILDIAYKTGQKVVIPVYPLSIVPEGTANNVLGLMNSVFDKYEASGHNIDLIGDSAGGAIVLSLVTDREANDMSLPTNVIALFPVLDAEYKNPEIASIEPNDPLLSASGLIISGAAYAGSLDITDPRVSPKYATYSNNYNLMLVAAETDILRPDITMLHNQLDTEGITHEYLYYENSYHDFILFPTPETADLKGKIVDYINNN